MEEIKDKLIIKYPARTTLYEGVISVSCLSYLTLSELRFFVSFCEEHNLQMSIHPAHTSVYIKITH